jgi:hypothetical protein
VSSQSGPQSASDLDRAATAREVSILTALVLMKANGDPDVALLALAEIAEWPSSKPVDAGELDAVSIAAQAIREAVGLRG